MDSDSDYESDFESYLEEHADLYCLQLQAVFVRYNFGFFDQPCKRFHINCYPQSNIYNVSHIVQAVDQKLHLEVNPKCCIL